MWFFALYERSEKMASYITVKNIKKDFKVPIRKSGVWESVKSFMKREYKVVHAIDDISFYINKGEIVGYIGPNGAGKSTTIKILTGILLPTSGTCKVGNLVPWEDREKYVSKIGVVFGQRSQLWWDIPALDTFDLLCDIYKLDKSEYQKTRDELISLLKIEDVVKMPVRQLSLGQRMRCEIAASLLHQPEILFLDEPTIGLDALSKTIVRDFIKKINKERKVTVILTTHDMSDIEALAKRILLIGKGKVLYDGSLTSLKRKYDVNKYIHVITKDSLNNLDIQGIISQKKVDDGYQFIIDSKKIEVSSFLQELASKISIQDIDIDNENLDNIILKLYKEYEL